MVITEIDYDALFDGNTRLLEAGVDFQHGTDIDALLDVRREAIRRGVALQLRRYARMSEVEKENRDSLAGRKFPLLVVRARLKS